jgi:hypothetical protein
MTHADYCTGISSRTARIVANARDTTAGNVIDLYPAPKTTTAANSIYPPEPDEWTGNWPVWAIIAASVGLSMAMLIISLLPISI